MSAGNAPLPLAAGQRPGHTRLADAVALHPVPEPFAVYAAQQIAAVPLAGDGRCFFPDCSRAFDARRGWQVYCCGACRTADVREARVWGHRAAQALLIWRMFKYASDPAELELAQVARRYVTQVQSAWWASRRARVALAVARQQAGSAS